MTIYVTPQDVAALVEHTDLVQLTNLTRSYADSKESVRLQAACDHANGVIDGYVALADLSTVSAPIMVAAKAHAINIAIWFLDASYEEFQRKYDAAIAWLNALVKSAQSGGSSGGGGGSLDVYSGVIYFEPGREVWNDRTLEGLL